MLSEGQRIEVYWPSDEAWYVGTVTEVREDGAKVLYDDGDVEDLTTEVLFDEGACRLLGGDDASAGNEGEEEKEEGKEGAEEGYEVSANEDLTEADDLYDEEHELSTSQPHPDGALNPSASSEHLTRQLQKVLDSINIKDFQQEQEDQEEWLQAFLMNQDEVGWDNVDFYEAEGSPAYTSPAHTSSPPARASPDRFNTSSPMHPIEAPLSSAPHVALRPHSPPSPLHAANQMIQNFADAAYEAAQKVQPQAAKPSIRTPLSTSVRNAGAEGVALLQGSVLSAKQLPGDPVLVCNPFVKVLYSSTQASNSLFACKTSIHVTDVQQDTRDPVWEKGKFSMEIVPTEGWEVEDLSGDVIFAVYDMDVGGKQSFVGQVVVPLRSLMKNDDEDELEGEEDMGLGVPNSIDKWLPLQSRNSKQVGFGVELHVKLKLYLPASARRKVEIDKMAKMRRTRMQETKARKEARDKAKTKAARRKPKNESEYKQQKQKYSYTPNNVKERMFRDRLIRMENERLQKRIDNLRPAGKDDKDRPFDVKQQEEKKKLREERAKAKGTKGTKGTTIFNDENATAGAKNMLPEADSESAQRYLDHVQLANQCQKEARELAKLREECSGIKTQVMKLEQQRRTESKAVMTLLKFVKSNPQKTAPKQLKNVTIPSADLDNLEVTPEAGDLKKAYEKLHHRRSCAVDKIKDARSRIAAATTAIAQVEEQLEIARQRYEDPEADQQLAAAHREVSRLRTDVETLKYEAKLGYSFQKNAEGDIIMMNDEVKRLKGKEERKRAKIKKCAFDRDAAREEYKAWLSEDSARDINHASKVFTNALKMIEKHGNLRRRGIFGEQIDKARNRAESNLSVIAS